MANYSHVHLSGTPLNGRVIPVAAVATPGTLIHTAIDGDAAFDEIFLLVSNVTALPAKLTVEFGGVLDPGDHIVHQMVIPANSPPIPIVTGQALNGTLLVRAFSNTANALNVSGYVYRLQ